MPGEPVEEEPNVRLRFLTSNCTRNSGGLQLVKGFKMIKSSARKATWSRATIVGASSTIDNC